VLSGTPGQRHDGRRPSRTARTARPRERRRRRSPGYASSRKACDHRSPASESDLAEELAPEAFVRVWRSWRSIRDQQSAPTYRALAWSTSRGRLVLADTAAQLAGTPPPPCWALTGAGAGLARSGRRAERSGLSGPCACASSASRRPPSRVSALAGRPSSGRNVPGTPRHHRPRPTTRPRTGRPGPVVAPPPPDHPSAARSAPAMTAPSGWGSRRRPAQDGPLVPARTGRSTVGRRWSRAEKRRTGEFGRLQGVRSPALNPVKVRARIRGEVSKDAPRER
jgi:hypothetical protein